MKKQRLLEEILAVDARYRGLERLTAELEEVTDDLSEQIARLSLRISSIEAKRAAWEAPIGAASHSDATGERG